MGAARKISKDEAKIQELDSEIIECFNDIEKLSKVKGVYLPNSKVVSKHKEIQKVLNKINDLNAKREKLMANWDAS